MQYLNIRFFQFIAFAYLTILPLNIGITGQVSLQDFIAVLFPFAFIFQKDLIKNLIRPPFVFLTGFLIISSIATLINIKSFKDIYEVAIFFYMVVIFLFFTQIKIPKRFLLYYGLAVLAAMLISCLYEFFIGSRQVYEVYSSSSLDFIAKRYFFTFKHPNMTGSFYALPVLCVIIGLREMLERANVKKLIIFTCLFGVLCFPLFMTVSKHMLITFFLIGGLFYGIRTENSYKIKMLVIGGLFVVALIFYLTVLFPFFPLSSQCPFINIKTYGMYMIHQVVYFKMMFLSFGSFIFGLGHNGVIETYPLLADKEFTLEVLSQYKWESLVSTYTTYMDAHNEYLNIGAIFGFPAVVLMFLFWLNNAFSYKDKRFYGSLILFYTVSILIVSLWDDILSKRWIWIALGILVSHACVPEGNRDREEGVLLENI